MKVLNAAKSRSALGTAALVAGQTLVVMLLGYVLLKLLGWAWPVVWPLTVALLLTTLTWPPARLLRKWGWPPALAATVVTLLFLLVAAGIIVGIVLPVAGQGPELAKGVVDGITQLREWASGPPLNIGDAQVDNAFNTAIEQIQSSASSIVNYTITGVGTVLNGVITTVLALFLMFFFLKDGPRFLPWLSRQLPGRLAVDIPTIAERSWRTLGSFVLSQAFVGLLDAVFIGIGLWIVGVPLVLPLAVLTFVAAFVPIVGALFAGFVAVLIALVFEGFWSALIVLAIILVVQQLEGNVFQPMIQSRGLGLHAAVVLLAVTLGGSVAGIVGSLLAVPVAALVAVFWTYLREQLSGPGTEPNDPDPAGTADPADPGGPAPSAPAGPSADPSAGPDDAVKA
ncbi:AI-2E family transporter [Catenuloplanes indicus]|uniref:PurR-regulated permease PerM n=1 Tax=Catenuloplanes indicus TaxID=137267 RepID=A0AAE3VWA2_9ACTN|nr:AI-2E family transporter [Catenuloplanes indicus]MDQ0364180.1 putative PurR-regulated permease PerM [Catenuloplanes indicus]